MMPTTSPPICCARCDSGKGGFFPGRIVRRPAATRRDCARARHETEIDAVRRTDVGARPGNDPRSARRHGGTECRRHDQRRGHPRDGLCAPRGGQIVFMERGESSKRPTATNFSSGTVQRARTALPRPDPPLNIRNTPDGHFSRRRPHEARAYCPCRINTRKPSGKRSSRPRNYVRDLLATEGFDRLAPGIQAGTHQRGCADGERRRPGFRVQHPSWTSSRWAKAGRRIHFP